MTILAGMVRSGAYRQGGVRLGRLGVVRSVAVRCGGVGQRWAGNL
jgi:hypothetical protein